MVKSHKRLALNALFDAPHSDNIPYQAECNKSKESAVKRKKDKQSNKEHVNQQRDVQELQT
jgi:hypothetical protein